MSIRRKIVMASAVFIAIFFVVQLAVFLISNVQMNQKATNLQKKLELSDMQDSNEQITALSDALTVHLTNMEDDIDASMYHAGLTLQKLDTMTNVGDAQLKALLEEFRVNDLFLAGIDGKFTGSTVPGAVGGIGLFDIWDGYKMLVTGESTELPSAIKIMAETGDIYKFTAMPRYDENGKIKGILETALDVSSIEKDLSQMIAGYSMINSLQLFEPGGLTLANVEKDASQVHFTKGQTVLLADIDAALKEGMLINNTDKTGNGTITCYRSIDRFGAPAYVMRLELNAAYYTKDSVESLGAVDVLVNDAHGKLLIGQSLIILFLVV